MSASRKKSVSANAAKPVSREFAVSGAEAPKAAASKAAAGKTVPQKAVSAVRPSPVMYGLAAAISLFFLFLGFIDEWGLKYDIELCFALGAALIFTAVCLSRKNRTYLYQRVTPVMVILSVHTLLFLAGIFYSTFPKFALQQFFLNVGGWFLFAAAYLMILADKGAVRKLLGMLSAAVAVLSLVSMELATSRYLIGAFLALARLISASLPPDYGGFEANTRLLSVVGNPNTFAPIAVMGMLVSIWLSGKAGSRRHAGAAHMAAAVLSGSAFVLSFSMGTMVMLVPALLGVLYFTQKGSRATTVFSTAYGLVFSAAGAVLVFALLDKGVIPVLSILLLSAAAGYLYAWLKPIRLPTFRADRKTVLIFTAAAAVLVLTFGGLAVTLDGPYTLAAGESFRRAIALKPGVYTLQVDTADGAAESQIRVGISSMSLTQAALKEQTPLADTFLAIGEGTVTFTVPEESSAVFFVMRAEDALTVTGAKVTGAETEKDISLKFSLVPEFIANRMQAIWVNDNAIQRFVFFRDGIRVAMASPIIGLGGGAYEGKIFKVSDYYYETVHTHNHYIQCFIDGGIFGLALFTALAVFSILALLRAKKQGKEPDALPFFAGCVIMIFFHSLIEVDMSSPVFKAFASVVLAWTAVSCETAFKPKKAFRGVAMAAAGLVTAFSLAVSLGRVYALDSLQKTPSLKTLEDAVLLDPFNSEDYKLSYLLSIMNADTGILTRSIAEEYRQSMDNKKLSADSAILFARYYLQRKEPDIPRGIELCEYYISEKRVNPKAWDEVLELYAVVNGMLDAEGRQSMAASVTKLSEDLIEYNRTLPKVIAPKLMPAACIWAQLQKEPPGIFNYIDSRIPCDLDGNGVSDLLYGDGSQGWAYRFAISFVGIYELKVYQDPAIPCAVFVNGYEQTSVYNEETGCYESYFMLNVASSDIRIETDSSNAWFTFEIQQ